MEPTMHTATGATDGGHRQPLHAQVALAICGAIGGASILEAVTSAWFHPAFSALATQPTAEPIALVGAGIGAAATLLVRRRRAARTAPQAPSTHPTGAMATAFDLVPLAPLAWQPVPPVIVAEPVPDPADRLAWSEPSTCQLRSSARAHERTLPHSGRQTYRRTRAPRRISAHG
jgi:hypothetical protein